jgi:prepilin-type N-terminal cleavage/methylation domain-containing protein
MRRSRSGVTLIEVLIAISLLSLLSLGILMALRVGIGALDKAQRKLMDNRRAAGAQRILTQQLAGFIPVIAEFSPSPDGPGGVKIPFFQGRMQSMRFVSSYSLGEALRGLPQILEFQVIPGDRGNGVRLVVNENVYTGPRSAGMFCLGPGSDPALGVVTQRIIPVEVGPGSYVLADRLAYCRFSYLGVIPGTQFDRWLPNWIADKWPLGIRIEMAALENNGSRLQPVTVTAPVHVDRDPTIVYGDF